MIKRTLCIENPCQLKCRNMQMVISYPQGLVAVPDKTVPIEDIGMLVLEHPQIMLSHYLLDKLVANNTAVVTCGENHQPTGMLLSLESHSIQSERFRAQIEATEPLKKQLWQQTVKAKIANQAFVLKHWKGNDLYLQNLVAVSYTHLDVYKRQG